MQLSRADQTGLGLLSLPILVTNTYADRNGKLHTRSSTAQMTTCVYCGALRWRYALRQDLCEKCDRFQPREAKPT
jgi:hypothetical protein